MLKIIPLPAFTDNYIWAIVYGNSCVVVDPGDSSPVFDFLESNNKNYELLADSYFIARDRENGIKALQSSLSIKEDEDVAFKIARFGFEDENWNLALKYFREAKKLGWNKTPGRLELLMGITQYELGNLSASMELFNIALNEEDTKTSAEGWINFIEDLQENS